MNRLPERDDAEFREWVRRRGCLFQDVTAAQCSGRIEFHHWPHNGRKRQGDDRRGVPLCTKHHTGEWHGLNGGTIYPFPRADVILMFVEAELEQVIDWMEAA